MTHALFPQLSVVIPTFNRRESLQRTLDGLARQDYPCARFEVIVVSDGSTDGTNPWLAALAQRAPFRLRSIVQDNAGPARARNRGVAEAAGDVIVFLDDDVEPAPGLLAAHAAHHAGDDRCVVIGPMSPDPALRRREPLWIAWEHAMLEKQYANWRTGAWTSAGPNHFYSGNASLRRAHFQAVGGFDETFLRQEDVELAYRLERACGVRFLFDAAADGRHRPVRTFESWLRVPYAYGRMDVVRACRGDVGWDIVQHGYRGRSLPTRLLARLSLAWPAAGRSIRAVLRTGAMLVYRLGLRRPALGALSVVYNLRYLDGVRDEIGTRAATHRLLSCNIVPANTSSAGLSSQ